jgi:hypothetical protein
VGSRSFQLKDAIVHEKIKREYLTPSIGLSELENR